MGGPAGCCVVVNAGADEPARWPAATYQPPSPDLEDLGGLSEPEEDLPGTLGAEVQRRVHESFRMTAGHESVDTEGAETAQPEPEAGDVKLRDGSTAVDDEGPDRPEARPVHGPRTDCGWSGQ